MQPEVWTPAMGRVHLSHRVPVTGRPVVKDAAVGTVGVARVEYDTKGTPPSVLPQSNADSAASGTKAVPLGKASVITKVKADAEE